jgi:hypothetical protein
LLKHASSVGLSFEKKIEMLWVLILPWQAPVKAFQTIPADTPPNLINRFPFKHQDAKGLAVKRKAGF